MTTLVKIKIKAQNVSNHQESSSKKALSSGTDIMDNLVLPVTRFAARAKTQPSEPYLFQPNADGSVTIFTWGDVADQAAQIAFHLLSLNFPPGSQIALYGNNCAHWVIADLAIWIAGHVTVPIYSTASADVVKKILVHSQTKLLMVGNVDYWQEVAPLVKNNLPSIALPNGPDACDDAWQALIDSIPTAIAQGHAFPQREGNELATIIYTSGTTGEPKGVMHSFNTIAYAAMCLQQRNNIIESDRMLSYLPLSHAAERMGVEIMSIYAGFQIYFNFSLDTFAQDICRARPTVFFGVPRIWKKFQEKICANVPEQRLALLLKIPLLKQRIKHKIKHKMGLDQARLFLSGAAPISKELIDWYDSLGIQLLEGYGMSENLAYSHFCRPDQRKVGSVGRANNGVSVKLGEQNEILVKSSATMCGYYRNQAETDKVITPDGYLRTGDVGEIDQDGYLWITGRIKEIFKTTKGKYVAPAPIEQRLLKYSQIEMACVLGDNLPQPIGLVTLPENFSANSNNTVVEKLTTILADVNALLEQHERLQALVVLDAPFTIENGALTPTLKVKRNVVEAQVAPFMADWSGATDKIIFASAIFSAPM